MNDPAFPVFRCYSDRNTWFRISSPGEFIELKRAGKYYSLTSFKASIHPERMFINDLIVCEQNTIEICTEEEFNKMQEKWEKKLTRINI